MCWLFIICGWAGHPDMQDKPLFLVFNKADLPSPIPAWCCVLQYFRVLQYCSSILPPSSRRHTHARTHARTHAHSLTQRHTLQELVLQSFLALSNVASWERQPRSESRRSKESFGQAQKKRLFQTSRLERDKLRESVRERRTESTSERECATGSWVGLHNLYYAECVDNMFSIEWLVFSM